MKNINTPDNITLICSTPDPASVNIAEKLRAMRSWEPVENRCFNVFRFKRFTLVEIEEYHIYQDGLDQQLKECGIHSDVLIFLSKHKSKDGRKILTVHPTGNASEARYGGRERELAVAAPLVMRSLLRTLHRLCADEDYEVTLEATHHGPSSLHTPSLYVEIGSTEEEWRDETAGQLVAEAVLRIHKEDVPVAVGFGGGHYVPRQTKLACEAEVAFGHMFAKHQLEFLDRELIKQAFIKSDADFAYFDRKSMKADIRNKLTEVIHSLGYEVLRESDIREMDGVPWSFCLQLREKAKEVCPSCKPRFTEAIKGELKLACEGCVCPKVRVTQINPDLLSMAERINKKRLEAFLEKHSIAYLEDEDGRFSHVLISIDDECARRVAEELTQECIDILRGHCEVEFDASSGQLTVIERRFNPERARQLGVASGPLFGKLARGEEVTVNGKTIIPDMVYDNTEKIIKLKNVYNLNTNSRM
jgi:D-tyrosyl-tRNA(Tyr) deacylase